MNNPRQMNPYCVQVELTEGCNLRCSFCGLNGIRGKDNNFKFMTLDTATAIADAMVANNWNSRIEFAMHGEPTMNEDMIAIIWMFRKKLPKAYLLMESNGGGLLTDTVDKVTRLFNAGLSTLVLDEYVDIKLVSKVLDKLGIADQIQQDENGKCIVLDNIQYWDYPTWGKGGNPHQRNKNKRLVRVRPIDTSTKGTHASLNNHAGAGAPQNNKAQGKRCAKPFREVAVRWDGNVSICCNDWRGVLPIGNVNEVNLHDDIWHSPLMYSIRRKLYQGERSFAPCKGCDATSYRSGILPDHLGKETMPPPDAQDEQRIADAVAKPNLAETVKREWE